MKMGGNEDEPEPRMAAAETKQCRRFEFDVLLSFSGSDARGEGFAGRLLAALKQHDVRTPPAVGVPENKWVTALPHVEASQVFLPIISESYADSRWRLSELAKMVASACGGRVILPVFLGVDPSDVRRQRGPFEAAFGRLEEESGAEEKSSVSEWRDAMKEVGEIVGYVVDSHADDRNAAKLVQVIVKRVLSIFDKLKVLNLSHLDHLTVTPDLANFPKLVRLVLEGCCKLVTIHESIRKLIDLVILNMSDCKELVKLPHHICHLKSLKVLMLSCCSKLDTLPKRLGDLESLTDLVLDGTAVEVLPKSVVQLSNLCRLSLNMCESLKELPDSIGSLHSLEVLILDCTSIRRIPDSIGSLEMLQKLSARNCMSLVSLPNSIGNARSLIKLLLDGTCIVELPNSVGLLDQLQVLSVSDCMNLTSLPECMGKLTSLCRLKMQNTSISYLPEDVSLLVNLHTFDMELCAINRLPQNFGSLSNLRVLNLRGNSNLEKLPPTFSLLRSLQELDLSKCNLSNGVIPNDFGCLSSLKFLMLDYNDFCSLPSSIGDLSALKTLYLRYCQELQSLPQLPASLTFLDISCCNTLERVDLTNLVSLQTLYLSDCEGLLNVCGLEKMKVLRLLHIRGCGNLDSATKDSLVKETFGRLEVFEISGVQASDHQLSIWLPNTSKPKLKVVEAILSLDVTFNRLILPIVRIQVTIMSGDEEVYGITSSFRWATKNSDYGTYCFRCQENDPMLEHIQDGDWIRVSIERIPWCRELQVNKCYIYIAYRPRETPGLLDFFLEENPDFQDHVFTTRELLEYTSSDDESVSW
ncbi:TMV resistance protein [Nymphaea thermarum]|nr:TMV resistance protein [Nymphaea thermarum]